MSDQSMQILRLTAALQVATSQRNQSLDAILTLNANMAEMQLYKDQVDKELEETKKQLAETRAEIIDLNEIIKNYGNADKVPTMQLED